MVIKNRKLVVALTDGFDYVPLYNKNHFEIKYNCDKSYRYATTRLHDPVEREK